MVKFFITIFTISVIIYGYNKFSSMNEYVSYNEIGEKIVRAECDIDESYKCKLIVGKHCETAGYKEQSSYLKDGEFIYTVICGKQNGILEQLLSKL